MRPCLRLLVALAAAVAVGCADTEPAAPAVEARELFGVTVAAVGDEIWVVGGVSGPSGSSPPVTSMLPEGWGPNRSLIAYGRDGAFLRKLEVPLPEGAGFQSVEVVDGASGQHLVGAACEGAWGCLDYEMLHFAVTRDEIEPRPLEVEAAASPGPDAAGLLGVVGHVDDVVWVLEATRNPIGDPGRLIRFDLRAGTVSALELPPETYSHPPVCALGRDLYVGPAAVHDEGMVVRFQRRPMDAAAAPWEVVTEWRTDVQPSGGVLRCAVETGELVGMVWYGAPLPRVVVLDVASGTVVHEGEGPDDVTIFPYPVGAGVWTWSDAATGEEELHRYRGLGRWEAIDADVTRGRRLIAMDGAILDVQAMTERIHPDGAPAPTVLVERAQ